MLWGNAPEFYLLAMLTFMLSMNHDEWSAKLNLTVLYSSKSLVIHSYFGILVVKVIEVRRPSRGI